MAAAIQSPEDLINSVLVRIGYPQRIGSLFEGSKPAKIALDVYAQTRDELLRSFPWGFAERNVALTLLKTAPAGGYLTPWTSVYPILPFIFEYNYPSDCLDIRSLRKSPIFIPEFDPKPVVFRVANDSSYTPPQKVILCNISGAVLVYTAQITDVTAWEPLFIEALTASLARRMAPGLVKGPDAAKLEAQDEAVETGQAEQVVG